MWDIWSVGQSRQLSDTYFCLIGYIEEKSASLFRQWGVEKIHFVSKKFPHIGKDQKDQDQDQDNMYIFFVHKIFKDWLMTTVGKMLNY